MIIALPTGRGKTLVAAKVAECVANKRENRGKVVIVLSKSIPLTFQHIRTLTNNCGLCVSQKPFYGGVECDWNQELKQYDLLCFTAGLFLDILNKGSISLLDVCLLIFDEAHHSRKKSDYRKIMDMHYFTLHPNDRPQVRPPSHFI